MRAKFLAVFLGVLALCGIAVADKGGAAAAGGAPGTASGGPTWSALGGASVVIYGTGMECQIASTTLQRAPCPKTKWNILRCNVTTPTIGWCRSGAYSYCIVFPFFNINGVAYWCAS